MSKVVSIDGNNIMMRALFTEGTRILDPNDKKKVLDYDWNWFKFSIFKSIYYSIIQAKEASEVVFAIDGDKFKTWRKIYWKSYKDNRKKDESIDWNEVFNQYFSFMDEIKNHFPVKVIRHANAEGDDVIAVVVMNVNTKHYIVSADKDFLQLYEKNRVEIYSPLKQSLQKHPNPEHFLIEQSLMGQAKDNIFNIKTPLDHPDGKRKPGFGPKALEKVMIYGWKKWLKENDLEKRYEFNKNLMDFKRIPEKLQENIMSMYKVKNYPEPDKMYEFMKKYGWNHFLDDWTTVERKFLEIY